MHKYLQSHAPILALDIETSPDESVVPWAGSTRHVSTITDLFWCTLMMISWNVPPPCDKNDCDVSLPPTVLK